MNFQAGLRLEEDWVRRMFETKDNLHVFSTVQHLLSINLRPVTNGLKADGLPIYFLSSRFSWSPHGAWAKAPFWCQKQSLNCSTDLLTFLPIGGDYHPGGKFYSVQKTQFFYFSKN